MELTLSSDQKLFQTSARRLLEKEYPLDRIRAMRDGEPRWSRDWWQQGAELGWAAAIVPEELGGGSVSGEGVRDLAVLAEELGAGVSPGPLLPVNVVLAALVETHGAGPDHSAEVEALVAGESVASWAVYEPGGEWSPLAPALTATPDGDGYVLDGLKDRVQEAEQADLLLVTARTPDGVAQFLVPTGADGVTVTPQWNVDLSRTYGEVAFAGVRVGADALVGAPGADEVIERQLQIAVLIQCAEVCAVLERVFAMTVQWAFDRYSFGRPLASYQELKHRFADMRTWLEASHATTQAAAAAIQERSPEAAELASVAKSFVGEKSLLIVQDCVQIHGGIGVTWEHDLHLFLRRTTVDQALYGTPEDHRLRLADLAATPKG
ncbi:alkylation response protein AidB-like acyl-CoA dehydrogenase [Actinocorallia herbida]|uniref:Alkylation response protein AidB-like acyl-CoA dehydrogenase n=1 Tax=Actinocorallia herbida TaxID=58109 RepID=A0A3N1CZ53_9ACTN|nr:acyl-CoA dehydrogenase [Actinocorallia herbida]ROO86573.1 alkylation response protein AidB-like acyl-CoA dehydrogenase [Actinocorallia herbida]